MPIHCTTKLYDFDTPFDALFYYASIDEIKMWNFGDMSVLVPNLRVVL
jgi:hypothetical protein